MRINVYASGSQGNLYMVDGEKESLLIEAGVSIDEIKKCLNYDFFNITGCLISHEHMDHARSVKGILELGIDCFMTRGTKEALKLNHHRAMGCNFAVTNEFVVEFFPLVHNAVEPVGFLIYHKKTRKKLVFATDTKRINQVFRDIDCYMVECNYSEDIWLENSLNGDVWEGTLNHFELENVKEFLRDTDTKKCSKIVLLHLSDHNSDECRFRAEIEQLTGKSVLIASKGLKYEI